VKPPVAKKLPHDVGAHGDKRIDDYFWLRERDDPEVIRHLKAENEYTSAVMKDTETLQKKLYQELLGRIQETDQSVPERNGEFFYYIRTEAGQQYPVHCRKRGSLEAREEVLLDENELAAQGGYLRVGVCRISPDHRLMAYSVDTQGSESYTLFVKNLETGSLIDDPIPNTYYGVQWTNDSQSILYNVLDEAKRPHKVYRHRLATAVWSDALVYHEEDEAYYLTVSKTKSRRFILVILSSNTTTEVRYLDADRPDGPLEVIHSRRRDMEYYVTHRGSEFFILTNDGAKNFRVMKAPASEPSRANWTEVLPHQKTVKVDEIEAFRDHLVVYERENGLKKLRILNLVNGNSHHVKLPEQLGTIWSAENLDFNTDVIRVNYTSLVTPRSVIDYNMNTRTQEIKKVYPVLGGYDPDDYESERIFVGAAGGARIPMTLVYRKGLVRDGSNPLLLYGYGAYGASVEPFFLSNRLSLLDRGFVYAIAHIRGGGELGRDWYEQGKLLHKRNSFTDFVACADHLIKKGYTSAGNIAVYGGSAGGLLVGVMLNTRPSLVRAAIAHVPFVDVISTMMDETIPLTQIEYEEWGNPHEKKYYEYMRSYSPYDNVKAQEYPHMLVTAGFNDPRVQYWEPAKWVAKLRAVKKDDNLLLLRVKTAEGHTGASGRYDYLRDVAFEYAFLLRCFGITE